MPDYRQETDKVLDKIEAGLLRVAAENSILGADITRWRWDEPDITLTWAKDGIGRNLHVTVREDTRLAVEVNAWKDFDEPGERRRRRWRREDIGEPYFADLPEALSGALAIVAQWQKEDLKKEVHLSSRSV